MTEALVVVAHESESIREAIGRLCKSAGYQARTVADGWAALRALGDGPPAALVIDVALPGAHVYEVVEEVRRRALPTRVVLVASIYNRTGYKRRPTSLYGADDYVEQHHIADDLLTKLERLIGPATRALPTRGRESERGVVEELSEGPERGVERAQRLARLIVADIALYNGDALDAAEHVGHDDELEARLRLELEEGRLLFELRVPEAVRRTRDFIGDALAELRRSRRVGRS